MIDLLVCAAIRAWCCLAYRNYFATFAPGDRVPLWFGLSAGPALRFGTGATVSVRHGHPTLRWVPHREDGDAIIESVGKGRCWLIPRLTLDIAVARPRYAISARNHNRLAIVGGTR
jgi:hypothetical protein